MEKTKAAAPNESGIYALLNWIRSMKKEEKDVPFFTRWEIRLLIKLQTLKAKKS